MLGFYPRNIEIYQQALLHKSSSIKAGKGRLLNNERLEFLGDAILDAIVADIVYKNSKVNEKVSYEYTFQDRTTRNLEPCSRRNRTG